MTAKKKLSTAMARQVSGVPQNKRTSPLRAKAETPDKKILEKED